MTITTATRPKFGDVATIRTHVVFDVEYDDTGHIIESREWYGALIREHEQTYMDLEDRIHLDEAALRKIKGGHETIKKRDEIEARLVETRKGLEAVGQLIAISQDKESIAPTEAQMLDIWPNPPYGTPLLLSLVDEPADLLPPYGAPLVEDLR